MTTPSFNDLPFSYRLSQRSMLAAIGSLIFARNLAMAQWPVAAKWLLTLLVGAIVIFALITSSYVVIRYPYLSLVKTHDGDVFSAQFTSKTLARITKSVGLLTLFISIVVLAGIAAVEGIQLPQHVIALSYVLSLFFFVLFLCFWYDPIDNPTISTYIRSTLGLGIILIPFFIPVLIIGGLRCRRLLAQVATQPALH